MNRVEAVRALVVAACVGGFSFGLAAMVAPIHRDAVWLAALSDLGAVLT